MSDMKCPFCQQELKKHLGGDMPEVWCCDNKKCKLQTIGGDIELWQELIRTRKALDVAVGMLKDIDKTRSVANHKIGTQDKTLNAGIMFCWATPDQIHNALTEIKALEQKDVK